MDEIIQRANDEKQKLKDDKKDEMQKKRDDAQKKRDERDHNKQIWNNHQANEKIMKLENLKVKNEAKKQVILKQGALKPHWKRKP